MATANTKRNNEGISDNELYNTPLIALTSLYEQYPDVFNEQLWFDPCAGLKVFDYFLSSIGKTCINNDLINYDNKMDLVSEYVTSDLNIYPSVDKVIMNPPFKLSSEFITKSLLVCPKLLMFNRINILESKQRAELFTKLWCLKRIFIFSFRVECSKGVKQERTSNAVMYAWYEFDINYKGKPTIEWIL